MLRREFSAALLGAGLSGTTLVAQAQNAPIADADFTKLGQPLPTEKGKIEVLEFFWYGCSHCFGFEPSLEAWVKKLPADVLFKRIPVAFNANFVIHQRLFYALEAMDKLEPIHRKVFQAIHVEKKRFEKDDEVIAFVTKNGLNGPQFTEVFNSFSVTAKAKQASRLAQSYKIEGVPTLAIHGRYTTSGSQAGTTDRALLVADELIARARKGA
jgi:protein dithiol oxidoreductase (disulfide-forming)